MPSLRKRAESEEFGLGKDAFDSKKTKAEDLAKKACEKWLDVRTFGQLFAFGSDTKNGVSIPIRGPMTIQSAFSVEPVSVASIQITKSVSGDGDGSKRGSDTMGMKHRVDHGIYVTYGAVSPQLAERTGFSDGDAEVIKRVLPKIFEGDASSARPEGSMSVIKVLWWEHSSKMGNFSSAKVHGTLTVNPDGSYEVDSLEGISLEEIDGF
jgi:CRISPR-associated protein Csd2